MLSQRVTRFLSRERTKTMSFLLGTSNNIRTYYNNPESIDYLAKFLRERQSFIKEKCDISESEDALRIFDKTEEYLDKLGPKSTPRITLRLDNFPEWWMLQAKKLRVRDQKDHKDRHTVLGYDLAAAHFVLYRKGKVRFQGHSKWMLPKTSGKFASLPNEYNPNYLVEALDLSESEIEYEGLESMCNLSHLKWLCFKDSETVTDWTVDKISGEYPSLEYLDISGCINVSERGLEALYRLPSLKTLIVTNHYNSPAFELTCYMLEDVNPYLKCTIYTPYAKSGSDDAA